MKKIALTMALTIIGLLKIETASAQADEIAQLLLNVEKLAQFKQILTDMKKGYEIVKGGYNTVKDISEGNYSLHKAFLDGLSQVSPTVRNYRKVGEIVKRQKLMVKEYRTAYNHFSADNNFTAQELLYVGRVYDNLFRESLRDLDELAIVITSGTTRMSDDERLKAIDRIHAEILNKRVFLSQFNNNISMLGVQRASEKNEVNKLRSIYGLTK